MHAPQTQLPQSITRRAARPATRYGRTQAPTTTLLSATTRAVAMAFLIGAMSIAAVGWGLLAVYWPVSLLPADTPTAAEFSGDSSSSALRFDGAARAQPVDPPADDAGPVEIAPGIFKVATVLHPPIDEMSGLARSRRFDDVWWVHNDSGDSPRLYAIDSQGHVLFPGYLPGVWGDTRPDNASPAAVAWQGHEVHLAAAIDWEDIAADDEFLYVADVGNNGNARRDLGVYIIQEPNPRAVSATRPIVFLPIRYPDQTAFPADNGWTFDCESIFVDHGTLYFISKHRLQGQIGGLIPGATLYRLDTRHTDRVNVLTRVDHALLMPIPTGAALSPDGAHLAVIGYLGIRVYARPAEGDAWFSDAPTTYSVALAIPTFRQVEAIDWADNETLRFTNEQRDVFETTLAAMTRLERDDDPEDQQDS